MRYRYVTCDVFTDRPFTGNPLAVFPEAKGLDGERMQLIARELNLPETAFVEAPSRDGGFRVRIFTPASELPFAGHPTIGTALVLASLGRVTQGRDVVFEEGAGPVPVSLEWADGAARTAWLTAPRVPEVAPEVPSVAGVARALCLDETDVDTTGPGPRVVSAGNPFLFVPLTSRSAVTRAKVSPADWERALHGLPATGMYLLSTDAEAEWADYRARLFAPDKGIPEDPATGSAAAALPGLLALSERLTDGTHAWSIEQGIEMGRPSRLEVRADVADGRVERVRVGGTAVLVGEGTIDVVGAKRH